MHIRRYVCMWIYCVYMYAFMSECICLFEYVCMLGVCVFVCVVLYLCMCMCVCMRVYVCACVCVNESYLNPNICIFSHLLFFFSHGD